jgi:hypothetical protein
VKEEALITHEALIQYDGYDVNILIIKIFYRQQAKKFSLTQETHPSLYFRQFIRLGGQYMDQKNRSIEEF